MAQSWLRGALLAGSVLLHLGALLLLLAVPNGGPDKDAPAKAMDLVWIVPAVRAPDPVAPVPPPRASARRQTRQARAPVPAAVRPLAVPSVVPDRVAEAAPPAPSEPVFDRTAALAAARKLAGEPDAARAATLGGRIEARRVPSETADEKLGRQIAEAKRSDCIKANGGGSLLTPLMWLLEKKGSGCKLF